MHGTSPSALVAAIALVAACTAAAPAAGALDDYAGRYAPARLVTEAMVEFKVREGVLTMAPLFWRPARILVAAGPDSFVMDGRPDRTVSFSRDASGRVATARVRGIGFPEPLARLASSDTLPVERLVRGQPGRALDEWLGGDVGIDLLRAIGGRMQAVPSLAPKAAMFLEELAARRPGDAALQAAAGSALVTAGRREEAVRHYRRALALDPASAEAIGALARMGSAPASSSDSGWRVPFPLDSLFSEPTPEEIAEARSAWGARDLGIRAVETVLTRPLQFGNVRATLRIVAHRVHGSRHFGAIIVPDGAPPRSCPVIVEAKGVSWDFFPLRVPEGLDVPGILGDDFGRFVLVAPGFRGETIVVGHDTLRSEGDRADAWDGATDDLLALLNVALATTPSIDPKRVCVFGRSRGGAVALLAAERDRRIGGVAAWAAPADWFRLMGLRGWTQQELVADGLRHRAAPNQSGGQFVNYFLKAAIDGRAGLRETRLRMIASSPLYAAELLPETQLHYGVDDGIVPERNGRALAAAVRQPDRCLRAFFHDGAGHDQDLFVAPRECRRAWMRMLRDGPTGCR